MLLEGMKITPLGGVGEVGRNCFLYEVGGDAILVDCGVKIRQNNESDETDETETLKPQDILPHFEVLKSIKSKLRAIILTHSHLDHISAAPALSLQYGIPVYLTPMAEKYLPCIVSGQDFRRMHTVVVGVRCIFKIGGFHIESFPVAHSTSQAMGLCIEAGGRRVVHLGDFKFNGWTQFSSESLASSLSMIRGKGQVDCLVLDTLNAAIDGETPCEQKVADEIKKIFVENRGKRIFVAFHSSNLERFRKFFETAENEGRKVAVLGRAMKNAVKINDFDQGSLCDPREADVILATGCQAELGSVLSRFACSGNVKYFNEEDGQYKYLALKPGDVVIFSSRAIPGNETELRKIITWLSQWRRCKVIVHQGQIEKIGLSSPCEERFVHVSGHGSAGDLLRACEILDPVKIIPYHSISESVEIFKQRLGSDAKKVLDISNCQSVEL